MTWETFWMAPISKQDAFQNNSRIWISP
jgi:hypothetical protein